MAPKLVSSDKVVLDIATNAICIYNDGFSPVMRIMEVLDIKIGSNNFCVESDARIKFSKRSLINKIKKVRLFLKSARKEEKNINLEGQLYGADIAD